MCLSTIDLYLHDYDYYTFLKLHIYLVAQSIQNLLLVDIEYFILTTKEGE